LTDFEAEQKKHLFGSIRAEKIGSMTPLRDACAEAVEQDGDGKRRRKGKRHQSGCVAAVDWALRKGNWRTEGKGG